MPSSWQPNRVEQRVADILRAIRKIREYCTDIDRSEFLSDEKTQDAVTRQLLIIAEASGKIMFLEEQTSAPPSHRLTSIHQEIPWKAISGMGNRIRHGYGTIDPEVLWDTAIASKDLNQLEMALQRSLPLITGDGSY